MSHRNDGPWTVNVSDMSVSCAAARFGDESPDIGDLLLVLLLADGDVLRAAAPLPAATAPQARSAPPDGQPWNYIPHRSAGTAHDDTRPSKSTVTASIVKVVTVAHRVLLRQLVNLLVIAALWVVFEWGMWEAKRFMVLYLLLE